MADNIRFDRYYPYKELSEHLHNLAEFHPNLMRLESIGKSYEGRDVWLLTVTNFSTGPAEDKPAFWADGNIHATEVSASSACLYLLHKLATQYGHDPDVTRLLDTRALYVVPRVNPDGAELFFSEKPRYIRSSTRPYPYDEEPLEGLKVEDMDGDGWILNMRIKDPLGPWKTHPDHPRLMVRREPTETGGTYYRLLPEGTIENWDGILLSLQRNKEGLDLNRNFPSQWRQEHEQYGAGPFPGSEPEVYNLIKFISEHNNITGGITFHTHGGLLLRPYGTQSDETMPAEDLWTFQAIGKKGTEITGYPNISVFHDFRYHPREVITGVFDDWMYDHLGVFAWTCEIWAPLRQAGIEDPKPIEWYRDHPLEDDLKMLEWSDTVLEGKGYIDWYPYNHPQLGPIEMGGWNAQYTFRNPPPQFLEKEIAPLADWTIWHALISPLLQLERAEARSLGDGTYLVRAVVDNTGWLPTYISKKALEKKTVRAIVAEIEVPEGATIETGKARMEIGQLEGRAYKRVAPYAWTADPTEERAKIEWVVRAKPGGTVKLTLRHQRAGTIRKELKLG
ncbi:MAG TPA: M14 family metallopeptidase [Chthonomonadaceae bacterium]|nr:M14 family metallopeptidase [Chthonomonadaceae bacterium]